MTIFLQHTLEASFIGFRQTSWHTQTSFKINTNKLLEDDYLSILAWINQASFIGIEITNKDIRWIKCYHNNKEILKTINHEKEIFHVSIQTDDQDYEFQIEDTKMTINGRIISPDLNDAHTGVMFGFSGYSKKQSSILVSEFQHISK